MHQPFADLIRLATRTASRAPERAPSSGTRTGELLHLLAWHGPMHTVELASAVALPTRLVWGLLKVPRHRGQVEFSSGKWTLNRDYCRQQQDELQAAARLLRANGWTVQSPHP